MSRLDEWLADSLNTLVEEAVENFESELPRDVAERLAHDLYTHLLEEISVQIENVLDNEVFDRVSEAMDHRFEADSGVMQTVLDVCQVRPNSWQRLAIQTETGIDPCHI